MITIESNCERSHEQIFASFLLVEFSLHVTEQWWIEPCPEDTEHAERFRVAVYTQECSPSYEVFQRSKNVAGELEWTSRANAQDAFLIHRSAKEGGYKHVYPRMVIAEAIRLLATYWADLWPKDIAPELKQASTGATILQFR